MERLAHEHKPKLIIAGASAYSLRIDWERFAKVAKAIGAYFMVDMAHYSGLIAAGVYPNPVPFADIVTSTTHKSLRGPRGGIVVTNNEDDCQEGQQRHLPRHPGRPADARDRGQGGGLQARRSQPELQGLPAAGRSRTPTRWPRTLVERGLRIVSGRTESHVMLVDLRAQEPHRQGGRDDPGQSAHMTCNKNGIPNDPQKPMVTSGVRLGTPALTTRGFAENETRQTGHLIADVLDRPTDETNLAAVRAKVATLTRDFPVYR